MTTTQAAPVMPPPLSRLTSRARMMGFAAPDVEVGDMSGVPVVRVTLKDSPAFRDVEALCAIGHGYQTAEGKIVRLDPEEAEYLATRSALAEALVLAMAPEARRQAAQT